METKYFQVSATMIRAHQFDLVENDVFVEDKAFFIKNSETGNFENIYKISNINCFYCSNKVLQQQTIDYQLNEISDLIKKGMLYKIGTLNQQSRILLVVRSATQDDLFLGKFLKENTLYYTIGGFGNTTEGPFYISVYDNPEKFLRLLEKREIYVLSKNQPFTEVTNKLSA